MDDDQDLQDYMDSLPQPKTYDQLRQELKTEQSHLSRDDVSRKMNAESEYAFDPETATPQAHHWVDRGEVMSCEGANHPNHRHFKVRRK